MSLALEAYALDHGAYPAMRPMDGQAGMMMVEPGRPGGIHGLTTPVSYLERMTLDACNGRLGPRLFDRGKWFTQSIVPMYPYAYYAWEDGWLLWSIGPDRRWDLVEPVEELGLEQYDDGALLSGLQPYWYNPTNGTASPGDLFRVKN